jgi:hypothetical protein
VTPVHRQGSLSRNRPASTVVCGVSMFMTKCFPEKTKGRSARQGF